MELMALGTPEVPLNRARVPRQAATAAKAAIKKDLLEQNRRVGAAQVSTSAQKANAEELKPDAAAPLPTTAAKQTAAKPKRPAKVIGCRSEQACLLLFQCSECCNLHSLPMLDYHL